MDMKFWKKFWKWLFVKNEELIISDNIPTINISATKTYGQIISMDCIVLNEYYKEISDKQHIDFGIFLENDKIIIKNLNNVIFNVYNNAENNTSIFLLFKNNKPIVSGTLNKQLCVNKYIYLGFAPGSLLITYNCGDEHEKIINNWTMRQVME